MKNVTSYIERVASLLVCIYTSISILQSKIYDYHCDNHHNFKFRPAFKYFALLIMRFLLLLFYSTAQWCSGAWKYGYTLKGIVHRKIKILSSFTHPQVVPNLYECVCSAEHKGRYSEECGKQSSSGAPLTSIVFSFPTIEVNGAPKQPDCKLSSKYLPLCSAEQTHSYRFGST